MNLMQGLWEGVEKCRRIQAQCREIGPSGNFLHLMLEQSIGKAKLAMVSDDIPTMIEAMRDMEGYEE